MNCERSGCTPDTSLDAEIFPRLAVKPPYLRIYDLRRRGNNLWTARLCCEQPRGHEIGPICGAEAGRHLAILGACAVADAVGFDGTHYFLAHHAHYRRIDFREQPAHGLLGMAEVIAASGKRARVKTRLCRNNTEILEIDVDYRILPARLFSKIFRDLFRPQVDPIGNPYRRSISFAEKKLSQSSCTLWTEKIAPQMCLGHFPQYYAVPVAILMSLLKRSCEEWIDHHVGGRLKNVIPKEAVVQALSLVAADGRIKVQSELVHADSNLYEMTSRAWDERGDEIAHLSYSVYAVLQED